MLIVKIQSTLYFFGDQFQLFGYCSLRKGEEYNRRNVVKSNKYEKTGPKESITLFSSHSSLIELIFLISKN